MVKGRKNGAGWVAQGALGTQPFLLPKGFRLPEIRQVGRGLGRMIRFFFRELDKEMVKPEFLGMGIYPVEFPLMDLSVEILVIMVSYGMIL